MNDILALIHNDAVRTVVIVFTILKGPQAFSYMYNNWWLSKAKQKENKEEDLREDKKNNRIDREAWIVELRQDIAKKDDAFTEYRKETDTKFQKMEDKYDRREAEHAREISEKNKRIDELEARVDSLEEELEKTKKIAAKVDDAKQVINDIVESKLEGIKK